MTKHGEPKRFVEAALEYSGDDCLLWPYGKIRGYGSVWHEGRHHLVTRLICERLYGPPPTQSHEAAHSCGNGDGGCCNPRHLRWATSKENKADRELHGTVPRGVRNGRAKLTSEQVIEVRALRGALTVREIGRQFGISRTQVSDIQNGKFWSNPGN